MDFFLETLILLILIIIQSTFGIGLLLFGTPTFLILGYDFFNISTLCSLATNFKKS